MSITTQLIETLSSIISIGGYPALLFLTFLDSTVLPVPNEAIMPFAGYLISTERFTFLNVFVISTIGAILGSLTSYALGYYGADPFIKKFGKYFHIKETDIKKTHTFFEKYGDKIILVSRFIPLVRQFISIPAGAAKMNIYKFILFTAIGSAIWNSAILYLGYMVGTNSEKFKIYTSLFDKAIVLLFGILLLSIYFKKRKKQLSKKNLT